MKIGVDELGVIEILDYLKKGYELNAPDGRAFVLMDGVLCCAREDGEFLVGCTINSETDSEFYFELPDTELSIEVGNCYKTRGGGKAFVNEIDKNGGVQGVIANCDEYICWDVKGRVWDDEESDDDIVEQWKD